MPQPWEQFSQTSTAKQPWEQFGGEAQPQSSGFLDKVGSDLSKRWQEGQQDVHNYPAMAPIIGLGVATGAANDITGHVTNAVVPDIVKQGLAFGTQATSNALDTTNPGQWAGDKMLATKDAFNNFMKSNPKTAIALNTAGNAASFIPTERTVEAAINTAAPIAQNAVKGVEGLADQYAAKYPAGTGPLDPLQMKVNTPISADMVRQAGTNAYKAVEDSGTVFSPTVTDKALDVISSAKQKPLFAGTVLPKESADINAALDEFLPARGKPMKMSDLQGLDSNLGDKAAQAYVSGNANKGRIISGVQDKIRDMVQPGKLTAGDVIAGSPEGGDILTKHAVPLWSTQAKMQDIEKIINRANAMDNPSTAMKTGFRNLMLNKGKMAQFSPEVQDLVTKAATTGKVDDLLGIVGSRLNAIAGMAVGGPQGAVVSNITSAAGRGLRTALKNNQADAVLSSMVEDVRPSIEKFADYTSPPPPAAPPLTPAEIAAQKQALMSPASYARLQQSLLPKPTPGLLGMRNPSAEDLAAAQRDADLAKIPPPAPVTPAEVLKIAAQQRELAALKGKPFNASDFGQKLKEAMTMSPVQARKYLNKQ